MKKLLKITAGLVGFIILALLTIPFFISAETLKKQFVEQASKATGRKVEIAGEASLKLFPNIEVQLEGLTVGNPTGFTSPYLIKAKRIATGAALQPLLAGNLQISGVTLESADIRLEQNAAGVKNWEFPGAKKAETKPAQEKQATDKAVLIKSFAIGDVVIRDSAITHKAAGKTTKAESINLTVRGADMKGALKLDGGATYQGKPVKVNLTLAKMKDFLNQKPSDAKLNAQVPGGAILFNGQAQLATDIAAKGALDINIEDVAALVKWSGVKLDAPLPNRVNLKGDVLAKGKNAALKNADVAISMPGGTLEFSGDAGYSGVPTATGKLHLSMGDLRKTIAWATKKPAAANTPSTLSLTTDITTEGKNYSFKNFAITADALNATGSLSASLAGAVPTVKGTLAFGMLDLNTVMRTATASPTPGFMDAYAAAPSGWSEAPIDLSALKAVNADLAITAQNLRHGKLEVSDLVLKPKLNGGVLNLLIEKASLYGGSANGTLNASAGGSVGTDITLSGIQVEPFLTALKGDSRLRGKADLKLNVKGVGGTERAIVSSLNGSGRFAVADGAIKGMNIAELWRELRKGFLFDSPSKSTDFSELTGSFTITNGMVSNQDLAMKSPALRVSGKGAINLPQRTIKYRVVPTIVGTLKGQGGADASGVAVPLDITGSMDSPSVTPDVTGMVQDHLADPKKLEGTIRNVKEGIKDLNSVDDLKRAILGGNEKPATTAPATAPATATPATQPTPATNPTPQPAPPAKPEDVLMQGVGDLLKGL